MENILRNGKLENNIYFLPDVKIERKQYLELAKHLEFIGGKWNRGKKGFTFDRDITIDEICEYDAKKKKNLQFFPTPAKIAKELVEFVNPENHHKVLEPSAGRGAIVKAIKDLRDGLFVDCVEIDKTNIEYLKDIESINIIEGDFLKEKLGKYDRIIANPPFTKNQDIDHVLKMYDLLANGGEMVSIMSKSWQKGSQKKQKDFQNFIEKLEKERKCEIHEIEAGEFKESGTNIVTVFVWIIK